jgi:hypothetical protein
MAAREERAALAVIPCQAVGFVHPPVKRLLRLRTRSYLRLFEVDSGRVVNIQGIDRVDVFIALTVIWSLEDSAMKRAVVKLTDTAGHTSVLFDLVKSDKAFDLVVIRELGVFTRKLPGTEVRSDPECVTDHGSFP